MQQPPAPAPQPPPPPPVTAGRGLLITGGVMMGVGGASLLFVALPSAVVRDVALSRAERDDVLAISSREARYNRARRADDAMEAGFWIGAPMLVAGVAILITGVVVRNAARNRQSRQQRVAATPGGVTVRF
ncbi:MAG: hypothetical protein KDK70_10975 [Myxococcales bacterium]|nr:hypothetical protein [Myxococcales bacterium]